MQLSEILHLMKIESYGFGRMTIDGNQYSSDLIISYEKVNENWWRETSHKLYFDDIVRFLSDDIKVLVVGTGKFGLMKLQKDLIEYCGLHGIKLIIKRTGDAVRVFNDLEQEESSILAAFHLTC